MTFNIKDQRAGIINNVDGDQHVNAPQHGEVASSHAAARKAVGQLRQLVAGVGLPLEVDRLVQQHLEDSAAELAKRDPDRALIADNLSKVAQLIVSAGTAAGATTHIADLLGGIAQWLGPAATHLQAVVRGLLGR
jgi:hypothetical protein